VASAPDATEVADLSTLASRMVALGRRRIEVLAWRDLDDPEAGGSEVHADQFMSRWAGAGLEVSHRTSAAAGRPARAVRHGYAVHRAGGRYDVFPRVIVGGALGQRRFDALVEIWNGVPWFSPVWCRRPSITFLHHVHGPMWNQVLPGPLAAVGRTLEARIAPPFYRRRLTLTGSEAIRAELEHLGFPPARLEVVPHGIEEDFSPGGDRSTQPLVVCVGRLAHVKRQDLLIEAAAVARERVPDLRLMIIGDGPLRAYLEQRIVALGAGEWVQLAGRSSRAELIDAYRRAWVVASASLAEGWGLTLTEAAACGTPAVATDIAGHRSSVDDGVTGVLAPVDRLGDALADVLLDHGRRAALGVAALSRASTLTWDLSARRILAALLGEAERRSR